MKIRFVFLFTCCWRWLFFPRPRAHRGYAHPGRDACPDRAAWGPAAGKIAAARFCIACHGLDLGHAQPGQGPDHQQGFR
jgi:mono/diheme cytochrome c family protein